jgi:maltose O-acetyltransferase
VLTLVGYVPSHTFRRWVYDRAGIKLDPSSSIHWRARFFVPSGIAIGPYTTIGDGAFLDGREGIVIGSCVNIAGEVRIFTREHDVQSPDFVETGGPVLIGDYAYLGTRVTVLPGVRIGNGAVVASGAVVTRDLEPYMIVGGVPATTIGRRTRDLRYRLGYAKRFQ